MVLSIAWISHFKPQLFICIIWMLWEHHNICVCVFVFVRFDGHDSPKSSASSSCGHRCGGYCTGWENPIIQRSKSVEFGKIGVNTQNRKYKIWNRWATANGEAPADLNQPAKTGVTWERGVGGKPWMAHGKALMFGPLPLHVPKRLTWQTFSDDFLC